MGIGCKMEERIISIDIETTGLEIGKHKPIAIGAVNLTTRESFYLQLEWDNVIIDPKAMRINKLDIINPPGDNTCTPLYNRSLPSDKALLLLDNKLREWAVRDNNENVTLPYRNKIISLGKNVSSFDLLMLKSIWRWEWPFHYRSIDINSLMFVIAETHNKDFEEIQKQIKEIAWDKFKKEQSLLAKEIGEHHALADAWWNIYAWEKCIEILKLNKLGYKYKGKGKPIPFDFKEE